MGVVRRFSTVGIQLLLTLAGLRSAVAVSPTAFIHDPNAGMIPKQAILRIFLSKESDVYIGGRLVRDSKIHEVVEFRGLVLSRDGYAVAYVGNYLPELSLSEVKTTVETWEGLRFAASPIAVDERLALMFLKTDLKTEALHLSSEDNPSHFNIVSVRDSSWELGHPCLYTRQQKALLPTSIMKVSGLDLQAATWQGGIVVDLSGALLGLVADVMPHLTSRNLSYFYLIPALTIEASFARVLKEKRDLLAGWLGVNIKDTGTDLIVTRVVPYSPADKGGLQVGDHFLKINDVEMENLSEFSQAVRWLGPDGQCQVIVERKGRIKHANIKLASRPRESLGWRVSLPAAGAQDGDTRMRIYRTRVPPLLEFGLVIDRLTSRVAGEMAALSQGALLVQQVSDGSRAEQVGLRVGDIIFQVNGHYVSSVEDVQEAILQAKGAIPVSLVRDGQKKTLSIQLNERQN